MYEYLDKRYAEALYEVAEENGKVDEYIENLNVICDLISSDKKFYAFITRHMEVPRLEVESDQEP